MLPVIGIWVISPGMEEAKVTSPDPVKLFIKKLSPPRNERARALPKPPFILVSMLMVASIETIAPASAVTFSPSPIFKDKREKAGA